MRYPSWIVGRVTGLRQRGSSGQSNQSRASSATCSRMPGSSNRWVAPGTRRGSALACGSQPAPVDSVPAPLHRVHPRSAMSGRPRRRGICPRGRADRRGTPPCDLHPRVGAAPGCAGAGAGTEIAHGKDAASAWPASQPVTSISRRANNRCRRRWRGCVLRPSQQVEQQGSEPGPVQYLRDISIARAVPAASAAVREHDDGRSDVRGWSSARPGSPLRRSPGLPHRAAAGRLR